MTAITTGISSAEARALIGMIDAPMVNLRGLTSAGIRRAIKLLRLREDPPGTGDEAVVLPAQVVAALIDVANNIPRPMLVEEVVGPFFDRLIPVVH